MQRLLESVRIHLEEPTHRMFAAGGATHERPTTPRPRSESEAPLSDGAHPLCEPASASRLGPLPAGASRGTGWHTLQTTAACTRRLTVASPTPSHEPPGLMTLLRSRFLGALFDECVGQGAKGALGADRWMFNASTPSCSSSTSNRFNACCNFCLSVPRRTTVVL